MRYFSFVVNESSTKMAASFHLFVKKKSGFEGFIFICRWCLFYHAYNVFSCPQYCTCTAIGSVYETCVFFRYLSMSHTAYCFTIVIFSLLFYRGTENLRLFFLMVRFNCSTTQSTNIEVNILWCIFFPFSCDISTYFFNLAK